ncbi:LysM domain-containing protein [Trichophyton equinum CBS 127.97]|uniref:LysM domain-containing protein n=1 Tax=Trichophyton equinum (strain ATCC MYA-4606 / CBS 127.97) TaxID=559882 RepID=F2PWR8_TRIEC|nr:LysM domain-containing protein [Trichophyton equinum CBS 127.97]
MTVRKSSCVESKLEPTQTTSLLPTGSSGHTGTTASIVTTSPVQPGIVTPAPQQPGMVEDCTKFYLVRPGDTCYTIALKYNITLADFMKWNSPGSECEGLYADILEMVCRHPLQSRTGWSITATSFTLLIPGIPVQLFRPSIRLMLADLVKWNPAVKRRLIFALERFESTSIIPNY